MTKISMSNDVAVADVTRTLRAAWPPAAGAAHPFAAAAAIAAQRKRHTAAASAASVNRGTL